MSQTRPQTLFSPRFSEHKLEFHVNAYNDLTHTSGAFHEVKCAIEEAKDFICITSWQKKLYCKLYNIYQDV